MIYTVVWKPFAERALTEIWLAANDKGPVRDSADAIDRALRNAPFQIGESREDSIRVAIVAPLAVRYEVNDADKMVSVFAVWRTGKTS